MKARPGNGRAFMRLGGFMRFGAIWRPIAQDH
jgi:hypothetical protein